MILLNNESSAIDATFDASLANSYFLSIRIATNGFSFCILDPVQNRFIQFRHVPINYNDVNYNWLKNVLNGEQLLNYDYQKVVVVVDNNFSVLVPNMLYMPGASADLLAFTFHQEFSNYAMFENRIKLVDAVNVFAAPQKVVQLINEKFSDALFLHASTPLLESNMFVDVNNSTETMLRIHIENDRFYLMILEKRVLKLFNCFVIESANELIYFVLFALEQSKLSSRDIEISLSGNVTLGDLNYLALKRYFTTIRFEKPNRQHVFAPALIDVPYSQYFQLFNFAICV